jgi:ATPase subunit of ABC transporter with duplicated ATPase domains
MSATLKATGLAAGHGARALFSGLDLVIGSGDVIGLVGANGAGKSTLLRLLAGELEPEDGAVTLTPATATVGHLPQEPERRPGETVAAFLARRTGVSRAEAVMNDAADALADPAPGADDRYAAALETWLALGGADLDQRAATTVASLGLGVDRELPMTALSGGHAARAGLAALLISRSAVLLLD